METTKVESPSSSEIQPYPLPIAEFWKRFLASLLDLIILTVFLLVITLIFRGYFFRLGPYGRLLGWGVAVAYFTYYHSSAGNGQTPGKRAVDIAVRDQFGQRLTWQAAFVRSQALCIVILFNNNWQFRPFTSSILGNIVVGFVLVGGLLTLIYGLVINRTTRQGPHDLIVRSFVVETTEPYAKYIASRPRTIHYFRMWVLLIFGGVLGTAYYQYQANNDLQQAFNDDDRFFAIFARRDGTTLTIQAWYQEDECEPIDCQMLIQEIGNLTLSNYDEIREIRFLDIFLIKKIDVNPIFIFQVNSLFTRQLAGFRFTLATVPLE